MNTKRCIACKGEIHEHYSTCPLCGHDPHEWTEEDMEHGVPDFDLAWWSPKYFVLLVVVLLFALAIRLIELLWGK